MRHLVHFASDAVINSFILVAALRINQNNWKLKSSAKCYIYWSVFTGTSGRSFSELMADFCGIRNMVIMSMETYEKNLFLSSVYGKLEEAEKQFAQGKVVDGDESLKSIREKHGL